MMRIGEVDNLWKLYLIGNNKVAEKKLVEKQYDQIVYSYLDSEYLENKVLGLYLSTVIIHILAASNKIMKLRQHILKISSISWIEKGLTDVEAEGIVEFIVKYYRNRLCNNSDIVFFHKLLRSPLIENNLSMQHKKLFIKFVNYKSTAA